VAISNRDRVGRSFELLRDGLHPFIDQTIARIAPGADWAVLLAEIKGKPVDAGDVQAYLMLLTERFGQLFKDQLPYAARTYANELRDQRNAWAHMKAFNNDDTYRTLDTAERLLSLAGAVSEADEIRRLRTDHQRAVFEAETRKIVKQQEGTISVPGQGLKPWREVLAPHDDVATGNFSASEFAADLHMVAQGEGADEYVDPVEFFRRTYLTEGLRELLQRAVRRVGGDPNASPIVNAQTNFGGGKTHSMLAVWHLFSGIPLTSLSQEVQDLVGSRRLPAGVRRVALVGTHLKPGSVVKKTDGAVVRTLWGELAWQLGGREAYELVADADASATNPGDGLRGLLSRYSPCLILIDEWVAYARQLWGREDLPAGTFDTQFTFAQSLTEVVKTIPGALLIIAIPASHDPDRGESGGIALEVGGPNGQEALQRLQNVVRRVADPWRPASSEESFEIVRRRLFQPPSAEAMKDVGAVARQFGQFYARHTGEFPREVVDPAYEARIRTTYPIHPELFDRLYRDWSTLDRFQRTRGVLRLMSSVVHALWTAQDASPMIMPGALPLDVSTVASEITQYLPDAWKPIIDADVDGPGSTPVRIDASRSTLGARALTRRLARSIFMGSAPTLRGAHPGVDRQRIWLGAAMPGDTVGNFGSALELLTQRATYLYSEGNRYWYDTQPSVTRTAAEYAEGLRDRPEEVWREIVERLQEAEQRNRGGFGGVHVAPDSTAEIPDADDVRLVILSPSKPHGRGATDSTPLQFAREAYERRGSAQRTNRNMLVFLASDGKRLDELMDATRTYLAWEWISERVVELNLSPQQVKVVETNKHHSDQTVADRISQTYIWVLVPEQPDPARPPVMTVEKAEGAERLAERVTDKLTRAGLLAGSVAARTIRLDLDKGLQSVWKRGHLAVGELWDYYCRYPYLTRLRDRTVLDEGVGSTLSSFTWELDGFALAEGYDEASMRYEGLVLPGGNARFGQITDTTLLVAPEKAKSQAAAAAAEQGGQGQEGEAPAAVDTIRRGGGPTSDGAPTPANTRFFGAYKLDPQRYGRDLTRLSQEILHQLASVEGSELEVSVEVHASKPDGFPEDKVRIILENARTLGFEPFGFADE